MKLWLIGGTIVGLLGVSFYLAAVKRSAPVPAPPGEFVVVAVEVKPAPAAPVVLQQVVDVTDIESLLDPPAISPAEPAASGPMLTRVGYEEVIPGVQSSVEVKPIPKSTEEIVVQAEEDITQTEEMPKSGPR